MKSYRVHSALLLVLGLTLAACGKDETPKTDTTTASGDTTTAVVTPAETTGSTSDFTSAEGKFSIKLPPGYPQPTEQTNPLALPDGSSSVDLITYSSPSGENAALFSYSNMGEKVDMKGKEKIMLDASRDNVLKSMNATLEKEENIEIDGHAGRMMIFSIPASATETLQGRLEMYMVNPVAYQVMLIAKDRAVLESPEINAYFDSFKLVGS